MGFVTVGITIILAMIKFTIMLTPIVIRLNIIGYKQGWIFAVWGAIGGYISFSSLYQPDLATPEILFYSILGTTLVLGGLMATNLKFRRYWRNRGDHSDDVPRQMQSHAPSGFVFGVKNHNYVIKPIENIKIKPTLYEEIFKKQKEINTDGHVLILGGSGSGKSSCLAIPTLRAWSANVFAIDIKGELYEHTKFHRRKHNIKVFDPEDINSYGYDPFIFIRAHKNPIEEAIVIAQSIIPEPANSENPFWVLNARNLLTSAILHHYETQSFLDTLKLIQSSSDETLINTIKNSYNEQAQSMVMGFVGMAEQTLSGITSQMKTYIGVIVNDNIIAPTLSKHDYVIKPQDLEIGDIYVKIPQSFLNLPQWQKYLTLMTTQFLRAFERRDERLSNTPILFLIDEFPALGKFPNITNGLATLRSKRITICLIIQSLAQLDKTYGQTESRVICDNCLYQAILNVSEANAQETFSRLFGTHEKEGFVPGFSHLWKMEKKEKRRFKPEDFGTLMHNKKLVLLTPYGRFLVDKKPYYEG